MDIDPNIAIFIEARNYLISTLEEKVNVYLSGIWDPLSTFVLIRETNKVIEKELKSLFPDIQEEYLPKCKFKVRAEDHELEVGVQEYLHNEPNSTFLGNIEMTGVNYDLYCRNSWDPNFQYVFIARYGHDSISFLKGSKTAAAEYMMGIQSPLSIAYNIALEEGFMS